MDNKFAKFAGHPAFRPLSLPNITLQSRVVRSATEMFIALPDGRVNPAEFEAVRRLENEPVGLFITGHTCVSAGGRSIITQNAIWDDCFIDGQSNLASLAKSGGTRALMQIGHGGAKAEGSNGSLPVITPDNASPAQIRDIIRAFADAAVRAKTCGFDGVQLHAAHYYLLSQWFYPHLNHRSDKYGGSAENRFRIIREIALAVKAACGDSFPVFIKINSTPPDDYSESEAAAYTNDIAAALELCRSCGIEAAELSGHSANPRGIPAQPYFIGVLRAMKERTSLPLMLVGGIRTVGGIEAAFDSGAVTVSMCRPFLRRPDALTYMFTHGGVDCKYCNACFGHFDSERVSRCIY